MKAAPRADRGPLFSGGFAAWGRRTTDTRRSQPSRAASVFCVGLILVVIPGSELFAGGILMATGIIGGRIGAGKVARAWAVVLLGNFIGSVALALAVYGSGLMGSGEKLTPVGENAVRIATAKVALGVWPALLRGILCNMLVCLAVILTLAARTVSGKILGIYFPIMTFVLCGYEHSIANMYFLPAGLLAEGRFLSGFASMFHNLIPVTIGNILGGLLVIFLHPNRTKQISNIIARKG
jgi:formate/nitrite transporter